MWPLLDEDDDQHQYRNFGQHRARPAFKKLVQNTQPHGRVDRTGQLPHAAQHHHHEGVHDVALAQVRSDIANLAQGAACQSRNAGAERKGIGVNARRVDTHARSDGPVLRHAAHKKTQPGFADQPGHAQQYRHGKTNDDQAVVRQRQVAQHLHAAAHPDRVFYADVLGAEHAAHQLLQHQADAPGCQQGLQWPAV